MATIVFGCDVADPLFYYHEESVFYCTLAAFFASLGVSAFSANASMAWFMVAGVAASLAFLTKQTTGLGVTLCVLILPVFIVWKATGYRRALRAGCIVAAGWMILPLALSGWLAHESAFAAYLDQVFVRGPTSKGPVLEC